MNEKQDMGLYIHIPFCSSKCNYCDFISYSMDKSAQEEYLKALFKEIDLVKNDYIYSTFNTIYIGGGTPSFVYNGFIKELSIKLFSSFHFADDLEFTIEVNPASFTEEKFFEYMKSGVNRISVGVQCVDCDLLKSHGRMQNYDDIVRTFNIFNKFQFSNVSGDVMVGLPGQTDDSVMETVHMLTENKCKHISAYTLQVEKHTKLFDEIRQRKLKPMSEERVVGLYNKINNYLKNYGYIRYELSNFAKPSFESKHNQKYWNGCDYLGLGVASHSYMEGYRYSNTRRLDTYIDLLNENKSPVEKREYITTKKRKTEFIMLTLRTKKGLNLEEYKKQFGEDLIEKKAQEIANLQKLGMIELVNGFLKITESNFNVSNSIILELI